MIQKSIFMIVAITAASYCEAQVKKPLKPLPKKVEVTAKPVVKKIEVTAKPVLQTQLDSVSYAFGTSVAFDLKSRGVTELNYALVNKGMSDTFKDTKAILTPEMSQQTIYSFLAQVNQKKFAGNVQEGLKFLEENKNRPGVITTPSGLQYLVLKPGDGPKPVATDEVTVHYKGTLLSGKQFDSSYDRAEPITFPLNQVIPGWTEGVQLMPIDSKYRFFIPYQLGYGEKGAGQDIPPYSVLIFEVELIKIGKKEEAVKKEEPVEKTPEVSKEVIEKKESSKKKKKASE